MPLAQLACRLHIFHFISVSILPFLAQAQKATADGKKAIKITFSEKGTHRKDHKSLGKIDLLALMHFYLILWHGRCLSGWLEHCSPHQWWIRRSMRSREILAWARGSKKPSLFKCPKISHWIFLTLLTQGTSTIKKNSSLQRVNLKTLLAHLSVWRSTELWNLWHCFFTSVRSPIANHSLDHSIRLLSGSPNLIGCRL